MTRIEITRNHGFYGMARALKIVADGQVIGKLRMGQTQTFEVPDGTETIIGKMDWGRTFNEITAEQIHDGARFRVNLWFTLNPLKAVALPHIPARFERLDGE